MSTRYIMCVKPNDTNKIAFSVSEKGCLKDFKHYIWVEKISRLMVVLFGILSVSSFAGIITVIVEPYYDGLL